MRASTSNLTVIVSSFNVLHFEFNSSPSKLLKFKMVKCTTERTDSVFKDRLLDQKEVTQSIIAYIQENFRFFTEYLEFLFVSKSP